MESSRMLKIYWVWLGWCAGTQKKESAAGVRHPRQKHMCQPALSAAWRGGKFSAGLPVSMYPV